MLIIPDMYARTRISSIARMRSMDELEQDVGAGSASWTNDTTLASDLEITTLLQEVFTWPLSISLRVHV